MEMKFLILMEIVGQFVGISCPSRGGILPKMFRMMLTLTLCSTSWFNKSKYSLIRAKLTRPLYTAM